MFFIITVLFAILAEAILEWRISTYLSSMVMQTFAIGFLLMALVLNLTAHLQFKKHKTQEAPFKTPHHLITDGVFRFSRNPVYIALILSQLALAFIFDTSWILFSAFVLGFLLDRFIVQEEEMVLMRRFKEAYTYYKRQTKRWL